jgi:DNA modification methylase
MPRHRWHYYKEGFSPELVEKAIEVSGIGRQGIVLDPFNGGGTTTLTAALHGFNSIGVEVNPFTAFLAESKLSTTDTQSLDKAIQIILAGAEKGSISPLEGSSTFSEKEGLNKWLFNSSVLTAFEGGWQALEKIKNPQISNLCRLALLSSAMDNCNAVRDGKCLRYRNTWKEYKFNTYTFLDTLIDSFQTIGMDIESTRETLSGKSSIHLGDARRILTNDKYSTNFNLCVTSPPYLNTFDYSDIYRPELFLGKFIKDNKELYNLRLKTVRSHIQAKWELPTTSDFGTIYQNSVDYLNNHKQDLMDPRIPMMVQAYFEDMEKMLRLLLAKAEPNAQLWLVVSNSAYAGHQIPVDLILGDIGAKVGWYLKEIGVLRHISKRQTRHSKGITELRESAIVFTKQKR